MAAGAVAQPPVAIPESPPEPTAPSAGEPAKEPFAAESYDPWTVKYLTGDWGGLRTRMEDSGISAQLIYTAAFQQNFRGGVNTHNAQDISGDNRLDLVFDFDKMKLLPGASFFIRGRQTYNDGVRGDVGSLRATAWVLDCGDESALVDQWWYTQKLLDDHLEFRLGKLLTPTVLFDNAVYARHPWTQFMNQNLMTNPAVPHTKTLGAYLKIQPCEGFYFHMAGLDPTMKQTRTGFDTAFHGPARFNGLWEFVVTPRLHSARGDLPGNYRFGWWYAGQAKTEFSRDAGGASGPRRCSDDVGCYLTFDQLLWKENDRRLDKQGVGAFVRYGFAHGDVNMIGHFWSVGGQYQGLIERRDADVLGFGVAQALLSAQYRDNVNEMADRESVYELYYAAQRTPYCTLTPDVQFITNPGGMADARDAVVGGVRVTISF